MKPYVSWIAGGIVSGAFLFFFLACASLAQEHQHPPQDEAIHDRFYRFWMRPDKPELSCCSNIDCGPAEARYIGGHWIARKVGTTQWHPIPDEKVERVRDNPDGRNHLCEMHGHVYCFIAGGGT